MADTPEVKVKKKVVAILKELRAYYFYPVTGGYGGSGVPDIVGCYHGKFFGIECKAGRNKPTALQQKNLDSIKAMGGIAMVINEDNIDDVRKALEQPASKPWVSLTDEDIQTIWRNSEHMTVNQVCRTIESKIKEKNI